MPSREPRMCPLRQGGAPVRPGSPGKPIPFPILSTSNRKKEKYLRFFSFFRFEVLKIDRVAHPAWLTRETLSFPTLSTSNRKMENKFGFSFIFSDRGAHPALADPSRILSDPGQKSKFFRGSGNRFGRVGIGSIRSVQAISSHFRAISAKIPKFIGEALRASIQLEPGGCSWVNVSL